MRAMFLKRNYVEKSKKTGKSMTIIEVFTLPRVRNDGSGEMISGECKTFFVMNPNHFDMGKTAKTGDLVDIKLEYDERTDRGVPYELSVLAETSIDLKDYIV